jgi:ribosomal protein S27AE
MTDDTKTICKRCGFANIPGDQFCGSCGAFLEWEGSADAASSADQAVTPIGSAPEWAPGATVAGPSYASSADDPTWAAGPAAAPAPATRPAVPVDPAPEDLVRCPNCGIANPASRTFCQSCGTTLGAANRYQEPSADAVAAAVSAVPVTKAAPDPEPAPPPAVRARPARRGIPGWVLGIAALGLVVGIAIVALSTLLRGSNPDSGAASGSGTPSGAAASGGLGGSAAPGSGTPGGAPVALAPTGATASSVVGDKAKFQPTKAIDGDPATAWQEGNAREKDEWIEVAFAPSRADSIVIRNGYQASSALYKGNRRLKDILITVDGRTPIQARLKDTTKPQTFDLGGVSGATSVRITIVSTYPGEQTSVAGTPFDDAALSEITVMGVPGG